MNKTVRSSNMPQLNACPGALAACENLESKDTEYSKEGTLNHLAMYSHWIGVEFDESRLSDDGVVLTRWFQKETETLIEKHGGAKRLIPEIAFECVLPGTEIVLTGHVDLCAICEDGTVLIIDYKFGRLEVTKASENIQVMSYSWLFAQAAIGNAEFTFTTIDAYIFSAGNNEKPFTGVRYTRQNIGYLGTYLSGIAKNALDANAKRIPSEPACRYCPAKCTDRCPESKEWVQQTAVGLELIRSEEQRLPANKDEVVRIFKAIKQVESFGRKFMDMLKAELDANPAAWEGAFELKPGNRVRSVADVQGVYEKVVDGADLVSPQAFLGIVKLSIGDLEKVLKQPLLDAGIKVKDQKNYIADMLGDLVEETQNKPSIKVVA